MSKANITITNRNVSTGVTIFDIQGEINAYAENATDAVEVVKRLAGA